MSYKIKAMIILTVCLILTLQATAQYIAHAFGHNPALCGPVLACFVRKYEKQEARYNGPKKTGPFDGIEKSLIEQAKPLIARARKYLGGEKGKQ
jgi:hypothetical protein